MTTTLVESAWVVVPELNGEQASALEALGQVLSAGMPPSDDEEKDSGTSLVQCRKSTSGDWQVRVNEAIGVIGCGERTWVVRPKIDMAHLLHLLSTGGSLPRSTSVPVGLARGDDFWRILFDWLLDQVERVVRRDLLKGYVPTQERLSYLRGTVDQLQLARGLLRGSATMTCRFEEFSSDIAPNRVLKSALLTGLRAGILGPSSAQRARRLLARFEGVGEANSADLRVPLNRETKSYSDAVLLARHLLRNIHRELSGGVEKAWCFLWPTPNAVEAGLREIVRDELEGLFGVTKTPVKHGALSFNPDLVIGDFAVGDVKYSLDTGSWRRSDVNQLLSFSAAFDRTETLLLNFSPVALQPEQAQVRRVRLTRLAWAVDVPVTAAESEFRAALRTWLSTCSSSIGSTP